MSAPPPLPPGLTALRNLTLHVRRGGGQRPGEHRVATRPEAAGIEVDAHLPYVPGDDPRHLDWNAAARLDALIVRRFTAHREVAFHLLVDASASMGIPAADGKLRAASVLATALAHIALGAGDAVRVRVLAGDAPRALPLLRHRLGALRVHALLADVAAAGAVAFDDTLAAYARRHREPGAVILLSDLLVEPAALERGARAIRAAGHDLVLLHVVGAGDLDPGAQLGEAGVLVDAETGTEHPLALTPAVRARYAELLAAHCAALAAVAHRLDGRYARVHAATPVDDVVLRDLATLGLVRRR